MRKYVAVNAAGLRIGESHQRAKLSDEDVELILYLRFEAGLSYQAIADKWDDGVTVAKSTVRDICTGRSRAQTPDRYLPLNPVRKPRRKAG